jgi:ssDNA-binding Zn-finger/Zn-ribbon topoisomerase 1
MTDEAISKNVKHAEATLVCPECGGRMLLRQSRYGMFYGCAAYPKCQSAHGCHPDGRPLGKPANKETKSARIAAHEAFDRLWKRESRMTRSDAYRWMQAALGMTKDEAHIGNFDKEQCAKLIEAVEKYLKENP